MNPGHYNKNTRPFQWVASASQIIRRSENTEKSSGKAE